MPISVIVNGFTLAAKFWLYRHLTEGILVRCKLELVGMSQI